MTIDSVFIKKTDFDIILACLEGKVYWWWGGGRKFIVAELRAVAISFDANIL